MPSFSIPLSGLQASQQALSVVANNLSNINTVGFKDQQANFRDLFYQTLGTNGSGDSLQLGGGTAVGSISGNFTTGNVSSTGVPTDVAINGNGFFVTQLNGQAEYTRAGNLQVSNDGFLTTSDGQNVMGYSATNGVVSSGSLSKLQVGKGAVIPASATTSLQMSMNLNANGVVNPAINPPADYSTPQQTVYDSLGTAHQVTFNFTKTAANTWSYAVVAPDATVGGSSTGSITFDQTGQITPASGANVSFTLKGLKDGAADISLSWNLLDSASKSLVTQTSSASVNSASSQNGFASGSLNDFSVGTDGTIIGAFSNEQHLALGKLALAQFGNNDGLNRVGNNSYQTTAASGQAVIGNPGTGGLGNLTGGALEQSNVDMATEFSKMIVNQRGFEANAKVITAFDQVMQTTIAMQR